MKSNTLASLIGISLIPNVASAAVVVNSEHQYSGSDPLAHTYVVSSTDLINGLAPTASAGTFNQEDTGGLPVLTNGVFASPIVREGGAFKPSFATGGNNGGTSVTYTLTTPADIASIDVFGGWGDWQRDRQTFSVSYSVASDPGTFITLTTTGVDYNPTPTFGDAQTPVAVRTTISESTTGPLAANVAAIRFDFGTAENGYTGYAEIDVNAVVPEPSVALLGALGVLGLLGRRRK